MQVTLEKVKRPEYEGGGIAYQVFAHAVRNGKHIKAGVERSANFAAMKKYAENHAKKLKCECVVCEA